MVVARMDFALVEELLQRSSAMVRDKEPEQLLQFVELALEHCQLLA